MPRGFFGNPYAKWFGAAFRQLRCASALEPVLGELLGAPTWVERDRILAVAYRHLAELHNALGITPPLSCEPMPFWGRPFTVIRGGRCSHCMRSWRFEMLTEARDWWEKHAAQYQRQSQIPIDILYGPGAPNEDRLQLIGDVRGKAVLEIGCGAAQAAIAFARRGARVTALDVAESSLQLAHSLATQHGVSIRFLFRARKQKA